MANNTPHGSQVVWEVGAEAAAFKTLAATIVERPIISDGIEETAPLSLSDVISGAPVAYSPYRGVRLLQGDLVVPVDADHFPEWLELMTGDTASPWAFDTHMGSFSLVRNFVDLNYKEELTGLKIARLSLSAKMGAELTATIGVVGASGATPATPDNTVTIPTVPKPFANSQLAISLGGSSYAAATEINLNIDFGMDTSIYPIGASGVLAEIPQGVAKITGSWTALFADATLTSGAETQKALVLTFTSAVAGTLTFTMSKIQHTRPRRSIAGPAGVLQTVDYVAYSTDGTAPLSIAYAGPA